MVTFDHDAIRNASKNYANKLNAVDGAEVSLCDTLVANGVLPENLKQNALTTKPEDMHPARVAVDQGIIASFTKRQQKLVNTSKKDAKQLFTDIEKGERRYWGQQVASIRNKRVVIALDKRLNPDKYGKNKERTDDNIALPRLVSELIKRIETTETYSGDTVALATWAKKCPIAINDSK